MIFVALHWYDFCFWQWEDSVDEKYPHVVYEERCKAYDMEQCEPSVEDDGLDELEGLWNLYPRHVIFWNLYLEPH